MTREKVLEAVRETAVTNHGVPLGERAFTAATGITRSLLWKAGFPRYRSAVEAAGLLPNQLKQPIDRAVLLRALALLTRRLGRFPTKGDIKVERATDSSFPSYEAFFRLSGKSTSALPGMLAEFCIRDAEFGDVAIVLARDPRTTGPPSAVTRDARVVGYVYLAKHGKDYKIGRSNDVTRRRRELRLLLPQELEHVHVIETDDPEGIERYWHRRFETRRSRGEWFTLSAADVAAFRRRRYQ